MADGNRRDIRCLNCGAVLGYTVGGRWYINRPASPVGSDWTCVLCRPENAKKDRADAVKAKDGRTVAIERG